MISDAYLRTRITEVQQDFAAARRWRRRLTRLLRRRQARHEPQVVGGTPVADDSAW
ncbi:hypothetical protein [Amycolatopsis sp. cmx-4-68]|uniref:hypothetical protein n=1 Tax=Amycolatopsis sp. cmx-4-68 TaxID=2790938 RepID=UPI003978AEF5